MWWSFDFFLYFFGVNVFFFLFCYRYLQEFYIDLHFDFMNVFDWRLCECGVWGLGTFLFLLLICIRMVVCLFVCTILYVWECVILCLCVWMGHSRVYIEILCVYFIENKSRRFYWRLNGIKSNQIRDCCLNRTALFVFVPFIKFYLYVRIESSLKSLCF